MHITLIFDGGDVKSLKKTGHFFIKNSKVEILEDGMRVEKDFVLFGFHLKLA